jgi:hypothetical protein
MTEEEKQNKFSFCNTFNFVLGFIYYPYFPGDTVEVGYSMVEFGQKFPSGKEINDASFEAAYGSSIFTYGSYPFNVPAFREEAFEFCKVSSRNCSIVTFTLVDLGLPDWSLSNYYYQLLGGACQDSVSLSDEAL